MITLMYRFASQIFVRNHEFLDLIHMSWCSLIAFIDSLRLCLSQKLKQFLDLQNYSDIIYGLANFVSLPTSIVCLVFVVCGYIQSLLTLCISSS